MWLIIMEYLVPVVCVHIRGVSPIQGAGLEGSQGIYIYVPTMCHKLFAASDLGLA